MKVLKKFSTTFLVISLVMLLVALVAPGGADTSTTVKARHYISASPDPVDIVQADGSELTILLSGDERVNYKSSSDGYTLLADDVGILYYAELNGENDLVISNVKASNPNKRKNQEKNFLKKIEKNLKYSDKQKNEKKDKWAKKDHGSDLSQVKFGPIDNAFPTTGNRNMLVILAGFSDKSFIKSNTNFNSIMNVGTASFKAFYQDNSYNALNVTTTVVGPYNVNMTMSAADSNTRDFIAKAVDAANNAGLDFSQFDNDNNGQMDSLYVIHAGFGEEAGAPSYTIWSHSWDLSTYARTYDGVTINSYATSPELRGASGTSITSIGVICHEFGHNLGAPDYYDTDGTSSGGDSWDLGKWDVMAGGSWNNSGDTPAQHCMYTKWKFGWATPTTLSSDGSYSLRNTGDYSDAYRINTTTTNEFFILENRQQSGWDYYLPGHGMLIYHVDGVMIDNLSGNSVNVNPSHQGLDIEEADNVRSTATYSADPFPGTGSKTSFTDSTTPSAKSWAYANTNQPVTDISESGGVIYFDYEVTSGGGSGFSGYYKLINRSSGYALDINSGSSYVYQYTDNGSTEKHWEIIDLGTGYYRLKNRNNGNDLDTGTDNYAYNYIWNGGTDKQWQIIDLGTGYYRLDNRANGYSLDVGTGNYVYVYTWNGNTDKQWQLVQVQ